MNLRLLVPLAATLLLLTGCSTPAADTVSAPSETQTAEATPEVVVEPLDLNGEWKQSNSNSPESYQTATITGDQIAIDWVNDAESTKAVYWIGSYVAPTEDTESYSWDSQGDVALMESGFWPRGTRSRPSPTRTAC
jgi:hypothetical protein